MEFSLRAGFVELDNLLKAARLVDNGAEAKEYIRSNLVKVNGQIETRVRRKLRLGDCVEFKGQKVQIIP